MSGHGQWTEELTQLAIKLRLDGHSSQIIANRLTEAGMPASRNSVIGKMHRLGIGARSSNQSRLNRKSRKAKSPKSAREGLPSPLRDQAAAQPPLPPRAEPLPPITPFDPPNLGQRVTLIQRTNNQCAWICNEGDCCGQPTVNDKSWCRGHLRVVTQSR